MERISLAHGDGGELTNQLVSSLFVKAFGNLEEAKHDAVCLTFENRELAFTTDSFIVKPIFFPGGNIGKLAIAGTVNDLAVSGAVPKYLSASFIIEEGFLMKELQAIVYAMADEAKKAGIKIVTGDTKVVEKGAADGIFINTTGIGVRTGCRFNEIQEGDSVIINGPIGDHGVAILTARGN